jgi:dTDP-4-amino-4,6-dideoxygalactose transaminase
MSKIPLNALHLGGQELKYVQEAVAGGRLGGDGPFTKRCQRLLEEQLQIPLALLTPSCTAALEMTALLLGVGPDDEVVIPSFTFVSTANAFALRGARLRYVDIRADTFNLDEADLEAVLGPRTKVVVAMHYAGIGCAMDRILELAARAGALVVEDAAQALRATWEGRPLGTIGALGCFSFHDTKNVTCGEGGVLLVNDARFAERAEILREKGTNRSRFLRGQVDKYSWVDVGSSYLPSELSAAFLLAQLEAAAEITAQRLRVHARYAGAFEDLDRSGRITLQRVPAGCRHNGHIFSLLLRDEEERTGLMHHLNANGVSASFHYVPLHLSPVGRAYAESGRSLPVTQAVASRLLRLPCHSQLQAADQDRIVDLARRYLQERG